MDVASLLSVAETAEYLGVNGSRVRALIAGGRLPARRVGRDWFVAVEDVTWFAQAHRRPGRPLTPSRAWTVLLAAERSGNVGVRRGTAARDAFWLTNLVRRRAKVRRLHALDRQVVDVAARLVAGGEPAGRVHGFSPRGSRATCDGYVLASHASRIVGDFALVEATGSDVNVRLRVVDDEDWPFGVDAEVVGPLVAAVDMLTDPVDDRSVQAALPIVGRYL